LNKKHIFILFIALLILFLPSNQFSAKSNSLQDVNSYIIKKKFKAPKIEYNHDKNFPKFGYRGGVGKVEGVVAHETANNYSTILSEISFMKRNYKNAFVHAFVDHERIIEIHPLDYGAWGAGKHANKRFVHVELVRVKNYDQFARSINNYATYIANVLYDYNLGVYSAEKDGIGTLWSHNAVSLHLGATNHGDPHGYFSKYGYSWNKFVSLVTSKYNSLVESRKANTSKLGQLKSSHVKIYNSPNNLNKYSTNANLYGEVFYIKAEANIKNTVYYLISKKPSSKDGVIGWVKASDIQVQTHKSVDKQSKTFMITGEGKAFNRAWGDQKNYVFDLTSFEGKEFHVNLTEMVGNDIWYRGILEGNQVWIHSSSVIRKSSVSKLARIKKINIDIYSDLYKNSPSSKAQMQHLDQTYLIREMALVRNKTYYLLSVDKENNSIEIGWVQSENLDIHEYSFIDSDKKTFYFNGTGSAYKTIWGSSRDITISDLSKYKLQKFEVNRTEKVGNEIWYKGTLEDQIVWIQASSLNTIEQSKTSLLGKIRHKDVKVYNPNNNGEIINASLNILNKVYYIKMELTFNNEKYYLISNKPSSEQGVIGFVHENDLITYTHKQVDKKKKIYYIKGEGPAYNRAWGGKGNIVFKNLSKYKNKKFVVNLTEKVGNNTWYRGTLDGETIWVHFSRLTTIKESYVSLLGKLTNDQVKIYKDIDKSSPIISGSKYSNTVYYIKKQIKINGDTFYLISNKPSSSQGTLGWVEEKDVKTYTHKTMDKKKKTFLLKGKGIAYTRAWGGSNNIVYKLSNYKNKVFKVNMTAKVGNNTWYRGILNGRSVWIHSSHLR